ncbi:uncharacterized protein LOC127852290 isoform X2 [Dreissena polymorpha]|uniref:uncharacterized protein LOC127852290 isoform X2 n=1 Tax=Dreissena polymorpha TaxID=45954 RepID=UPI0022647D7A|nr:uncharacterized protein LOC127852290 isoform X2 [Dreissena polymorpha]
MEEQQREPTPGEASSEDETEETSANQQDDTQKAMVKDVDKDIDDMVDYNVNNGLVDPDGSNMENITVDTAESSTLNFDEMALREDQGQGDLAVTKMGDANGEYSFKMKEIPDGGLEESFLSNDSSAIAEAVVRKALDNAVNIVRADVADSNTNASAKQVDTQPKTDARVGLFQYQDNSEQSHETDEDEISFDEAEPEIKSDTDKAKNTDAKVGLFQYLDERDNDNNNSKSPESDVSEEAVESFDDEDEEKSNIMKLYGLEDMDLEPVSPVSPKSASPSMDDDNDDTEQHLDHNEDTEHPVDDNDHKVQPMDDNDYKVQPVLDVQRQVYEPLSRSFSVTREASSSESSPRSGSNCSKEAAKERSHGIKNEKDDELEFDDHYFKENGDRKQLEVDKENGMDKSDYINGGTKTDDINGYTKADDFYAGTEKTENKSVSISPPLVQYESVKENGKFRIIKTAKDSMGIRVGSELLTPKNSPNNSPRESEKSDKSERKSREDKTKEQEYKTKEGEDKSRKDATKRTRPEEREVVEDVLGADKVNTSRPEEDAEDMDRYETGLDMERIRALLQRESARDCLTEDNSRSGEQVFKPSREIQEPDAQDRKSRIEPHGREGKREDTDMLESESRYLNMDNYGPSVYRSHVDGSLDSQDPSQVGTLYEDELLRRAYAREANQSTSLDQSAASRGVASDRSADSGVIPGFKTLQQQQAKWSDMFHTLEAEHRRELRSQYEKHQYNIRRLQQQMEHELQKQHLAIRKKLDIHKEALAKMSPERDTGTDREMRYSRSPNRSSSPELTRSAERSRSSADRSRSRDRPTGADELSALQSSFDKKTWREIYREVREEEDRSPSSPRPLKRSLNEDFDTVNRSNFSGQRSRSPPRGQSDMSRSREGDRSSYVDHRHSGSERDDHRQKRSPEVERSRSFEKSQKSDRQRAGDVSPHVQDLLNMLSDSRHSLRDLQEGNLGPERPRAGVYSSPMPLGARDRKNEDMSRSASRDVPRESRLSHSQNDSSRAGYLKGLPMDRAELYEDRLRPELNDSLRSDDSQLSQSTRMNLREKHAKHLNDLRAYYEDEIRELRKALSGALEVTGVSADASMQSTVHSHLLEAENRHLAEKCRRLETDLDEKDIKIRTLEQKLTGVEKRASEYAAAFTDSQTMSIQNRAHIEELQRYCRERDDLIGDLESRVTSAEDSAKIYKRNLDDEMELHRQDKISLQRLLDRYESLEREFKLLQETMTATETKLYETRTEVVELNRTISKLELENKRLGRENDNLRHKVTQSLNLSTLHESFGSPVSPRDEQSRSRPKSSPSKSSNREGPFENPKSTPPDPRVPGFATALSDWTPSSSKSKSVAAANQSMLEKSASRSMSDLAKERRGLKSGRPEESHKGRQAQSSEKSEKQSRHENPPRSAKDEVPTRDQTPHREQTRERTPNTESTRARTSNGEQTRDRTPNREQKRDQTPPRRERSPARKEQFSDGPAASQRRPESPAESDVSDYSPLLKAERDLFKLRDMMRQAVAVKPAQSPPQLKLQQKKFYGSERPTSKDDYYPDLGVQRGRKEKPALSSHASVAKTKPSQAEKSGSETTGKKTSSNKHDKNLKSRERSSKESEKDLRRTEHEADGDVRGAVNGSHGPLRNGNIDSSTRFNIDINEERKTLSVTPRKGDNQFSKPGDQGSSQSNGSLGNRNQEQKGADGESKVEGALDLMRTGQLTARPLWENVHTSMVKPKNDLQEKNKAIEQRVRERLQEISDMESRYDGLQAEKRQLESSISKIPMHGRVDRQSRQHKEEMEGRLESVVRELGSLRMSLKRYNVLKTAG